jgi:hypothetical protein
MDFAILSQGRRRSGDPRRGLCPSRLEHSLPEFGVPMSKQQGILAKQVMEKIKTYFPHVAHPIWCEFLLTAAA